MLTITLQVLIYSRCLYYLRNVCVCWHTTSTIQSRQSAAILIPFVVATCTLMLKEFNRMSCSNRNAKTLPTYCFTLWLCFSLFLLTNNNNESQKKTLKRKLSCPVISLSRRTSRHKLTKNVPFPIRLLSTRLQQHSSIATIYVANDC